MADNLTVEQRSHNMAQIRGRGNLTTEERLVALLRVAQIRGWRRHVPLQGNPDFVFRRERVAVFVDGCFWHGCPKCFRMPKSNIDYWQRKIGRNRVRDRRTTRELKLAGWQVIRIWEHSLGQPNRVAARLRKALARGGSGTSGNG